MFERGGACWVCAAPAGSAAGGPASAKWSGRGRNNKSIHLCNVLIEYDLAVLTLLNESHVESFMVLCRRLSPASEGVNSTTHRQPRSPISTQRVALS